MSATRESIDGQVLAWMREPRFDDDEGRFERLALALFEFQFEHCEVYRRFWEGRNRTPGTVETWREIPAVPTSAFKEVALRCFPALKAMLPLFLWSSASRHCAAFNLAAALSSLDGSCSPP